MGPICCAFSLLLTNVRIWKLCCSAGLSYEELWNHMSLQKRSRASFTNAAFHRPSARAVGDLCWLVGNTGVRAGAPFMAHNTFTATSLPCQVLGFLFSIPGCLQSSCLCCAETRLFHKPWGNLPVQIRQVQRLVLKVLSWGSASVKPGSKTSIWVWLFPA